MSGPPNRRLKWRIDAAGSRTLTVGFYLTDESGRELGLAFTIELDPQDALTLGKDIGAAGLLLIDRAIGVRSLDPAGMDIDTAGIPQVSSIPPKPLAQTIFDSANTFYEAGLRCSEPVPTRTGSIKAMIPSITNFAFSAELYLKCLHVSTNHGPATPTHDLRALFESLQPETKVVIERHMSTMPGQSDSCLARSLEDIALTFVKWRYVYDKTSVLDRTLRTDTLVYFSQSLFRTCVDLHPDWEMTEGFAARIRSKPQNLLRFVQSQGGSRLIYADVEGSDLARWPS